MKICKHKQNMHNDNLCVCLCVCVFLYMFVCVFLYVFVCVCICVSECVGVCVCCIEHFYQFTPISMLCVKFEIFCTITPFCQHIYEYYHTKIHCHNSFETRRESRFESLKVLSYDFFGGRWSSAGSLLFALLQGSFLLSPALRISCLLWLWSPRLTGPLGEFNFT